MKVILSQDRKWGRASRPDEPDHGAAHPEDSLYRSEGFASKRVKPADSSGFSLVEVILAVGIFAGSVTVILALLTALTRESAHTAATMTALRLPDAVRVELQRVAVAGGFDALAGQTRAMAMPLPDTLTLAATHDAARVQSLSFQPPVTADQIAETDRYYSIEAWTFGQAPLAFAAGSNSMALHLRVSWPYHTPGSVTETPLADREQIAFNLVLNR